MNRRPAETVAGGLGAAAAVSSAFAGNWEAFTTAIVVGIAPAIVTTWVSVGGAKGIAELFWRGRRSDK